MKPKTNRTPPEPTGWSRRTFLQTTARSAALVGAAPLVVPRRAFGANERLGVGQIGVGGRGSYHLATVLGMINQGEPLEVIGISDAYGPRQTSARQPRPAR